MYLLLLFSDFLSLMIPNFLSIKFLGMPFMSLNSVVRIVLGIEGYNVNIVMMKILHKLMYMIKGLKCLDLMQRSIGQAKLSECPLMSLLDVEKYSPNT